MWLPFLAVLQTLATVQRATATIDYKLYYIYATIYYILYCYYIQYYVLYSTA